ncbi:hypothetical protein K432DRAFT_299382 [Lepidopterella palustris CBS 459.81]|uniref:Plasma membrane fusion protein PRM1 n=1 Tax=Lepidopterella palustris CBS 459.81 TaxID=1314670 RepID=A0A8E2JEG9_9PEZI|nr:hypothetical protein K432DRAFT_299382 [Lepidopterella palustris CBS 459.81]
MASSENQQHNFPAVPPSLSAGDHEMRDYYAPQDAPRPTSNQAPYLTPYLGLRARLSQVWINRWTILLLLVLVRTLIAIGSIDDNLASARKEALHACTEVENIGSTMASMPHYMSQGVNELTATGVEKAVDGLMSMLNLSVTGVEEIVLFVINMMTSTYVCLITLAVGGSLHAAVALGDEVLKILNSTVPEIGDDIAGIASSFENDFNKFLNTLKSIPFANVPPPTLNLDSDIQKLKNLTLPNDIQNGLNDLNNSIPTFAEVQNFTNNVIRLPFEEVRNLTNDYMTNFTFDRSLLPVPQKEQLTFCSDSNGINDFFDGLVEMEIVARKIFLVVIIILAVLACIPMAYREIRRWRWMQQRSLLVTQNTFDPMDVVYISSRPYTSTFGITVAKRFGSTRRQTIIRWAVAYATSVPALFVLSLGVAGLFACLCQYILLKAIEREVPVLTNEVANFADKVIHSLNNASENWSTGVNHAISTTNTDINSNILSWVNTTTTAVNGTLNEFVDQMTTTLNNTFGGTILYEPITGVLNCLVTLKIQGIQKALTWVSDNAHVDFPQLSNNTFSLGAVAKLSNDTSLANLLSDPSSTTKDDVSAAITDLTDKLQNGIRTEALISTFVVLLWVIIALIGVVRACVLLFGHEKTRGEGGQAYTIDPATDNLRGHNYPPPETAAPPYEYPVNKAAPYTLQPRPFPTFEPSSGGPSSEAEKIGQVDAHNVGDSVARPNHLRTSSHGHLGGNSPFDEKSATNPFAD